MLSLALLPGVHIFLLFFENLEQIISDVISHGNLWWYIPSIHYYMLIYRDMYNKHWSDNDLQTKTRYRTRDRCKTNYIYVHIDSDWNYDFWASIKLQQII
jgi:hypothetical protein